MYALTHSILHTSSDTLTNHAVLIDGQRIVDVVAIAQLPTDCPQVDLQGCHVAPGFIDLQLNGCGGVMFNDTITAETLDTMHRTNLRSGTTSFLPTLITTSDQDMEQAIALVADYRKTHPLSVLGLHLEGPYLNPKRKGIHNETYVRTPDPAMIQHIAAAGREVVCLVTLAPEMVPVADIQRLTEAGIIVSAGHTDATYEEAIAGFDAGVRMVTHLFNAMSPWQGRRPGVVGATFDRPDIYAGIIADRQHVHDASISLSHRLKGEKLILVTDATPPTGTQMDSFWIGGQEVFYRDGKCISAEGTLGGSALTMMEAIANCVQHMHISLDEALRMASLYPAQLLGMDDQMGAIAPGYLANLAIFDDQFAMVETIDQGQRIGLRNPSALGGAIAP
ncbi:MAG: N-acetylglucosamine-6-phosphate deacetylase [Synechococcales cyanobacterium T60_A2020_003]|nr:N-acetylglucosamine-6-phosphate deacetylase [Synechococcales cyanobacterium T60_A2020_003]